MYVQLGSYAFGFCQVELAGGVSEEHCAGHCADVGIGQLLDTGTTVYTCPKFKPLSHLQSLKVCPPTQDPLTGNEPVLSQIQAV